MDDNHQYFHNKFSELQKALQGAVVGVDHLIERLLVALVSHGHVLLEGVPGLAKTRTLSALCKCLQVEMSRIQFTPDLLPSDLVGTEIYRPQSGDFTIRKGPVFANVVLADEINRAPAKVQSALLQAMQEREISIGEETFSLPDPFLVLATQNPIEQEGTYQLPEAQLDRFLLKVCVEYPEFDQELKILELISDDQAHLPELPVVFTSEDIRKAQQASLTVHIDPKIDRYIVSIVQASRSASDFGLEGMIEWGASPRASIALKHCARSLAFIRGNTFVTPDHVRELATEILRHRILVSFEAEARGIDSDEVIRVLLENITAP